MLQKVDMPAYVVDNVGNGSGPFSKSLPNNNNSQHQQAAQQQQQHQQHQHHNNNHHHHHYPHQQQQQQQQQPSLPGATAEDQPTAATEDLPGAWSKQMPPSINGVANSMDGYSLQTSRSSDAVSARDRDRTPSRQESTLSIRSKPSYATEQEKRSLDTPALTTTSTAEDEGYFTAVPFITTNKASGHPRSPLPRSSPPPPQDPPVGLNPRSVSMAGSPSPGSALPPVSENINGHQPTADERMLRVPHSAHRASSPPAFPQSSSSIASASSSVGPNRLTHRHTLEVPKVSRTSREGQSASDDATILATGRFSPNTPNKRRGSSQMVRRTTRSINSDVRLDEVHQDEDAARWTEHIKQKRASKRKRDEDDERVVVGTKVDQNHVNWVTAYNMLTGIRFCVSRTNAKIDRELNDADFDSKHKFSFDITGNELTPSAKYDFKFKDYSPWVFRHLRTIFQLDPADYLVSLTAKYILSELGSPGKSGSFFYFSRDYKYIIKTIHHAEHKFLRKILRNYYDHVRANPNTLLSQFYGLHRVKIPYGRKIHFVVMNNLFPPHRDIHRTFDLKGSTVGRDFKEEDLEKNPRATLKDLNWLRRNLHLEFGPEKKKAFVEQMKRDVALLQKLKIMDYSLLVGIHDLERGNEEKLRDKTLQVFQPGGDKADEQPHPNMLIRTPSKLENARKARELRELIKNQRPVPMDQTLDRMPDFVQEPSKKNFYFYSDDGGFRATHEDNSLGEEIYYLGIIDCLTHYSFIKRFEHFWKGMSAPESQISAIPPERYGDRFIKFISGITKTRERAEYEKEHPEVLNPSIGTTVRQSEGIVDDPQLAGVNLVSSADPVGTAQVIRQAEKQADKSRKHGAKEDEVPERSISAVRSPDSERGDMITLPVIGEAIESGSANSANMTPRHSKDSLRGRKLGQHPQYTTVVIGNAEMSNQSLGEVPPPTPPKTGIPFANGYFERGRVPNKPPPTPPKDEPKRLSRSSLDKELPPVPGLIPQASTTISSSPERASEDELGGIRPRVSGLSA